MGWPSGQSLEQVDLLHARTESGGLGWNPETGQQHGPGQKVVEFAAASAAGVEPCGAADRGLASGAVKTLSQLESLIISDGKVHVGKQFWEIAEDEDF